MTVEVISPEESVSSGLEEATRFLYFRYGRLFVVLDRDLRVVAVALCSGDRPTISRPVVRELYARADSRVPGVGDYLMAARARFSYLVLRAPRLRPGGEWVLRVRQVGSPPPPGAVVLRWRWTPGKLTGVVSDPPRVLCLPSAGVLRP